MILRQCVVLLRPLSQHNRIASRKDMPSMKIHSCIRGFHVYKEVLTPVMKEILICSRESTNLQDPFTVKVSKSETIVGNLPRSISLVCSLFFKMVGSISWTKNLGDSVDTDVYSFLKISQQRNSYFVNF